MELKDKIREEQLKDIIHIVREIEVPSQVLNPTVEAPISKNLFDEFEKDIDSIEKALNIAGSMLGDSEVDEIEKAINHKYYKREGTPGNYVYYYTEAEYKNRKLPEDSKRNPAANMMREGRGDDDKHYTYEEMQAKAKEAYPNSFKDKELSESQEATGFSDEEEHKGYIETLIRDHKDDVAAWNQHLNNSDKDYLSGKEKFPESITKQEKEIESEKELYKKHWGKEFKGSDKKEDKGGDLQIISKISSEGLSKFLSVNWHKTGKPKISNLDKNGKVDLILNVYKDKLLRYKQDYVDRLNKEFKDLNLRYLGTKEGEDPERDEELRGVINGWLAIEQKDIEGIKNNFGEWVVNKIKQYK